MNEYIPSETWLTFFFGMLLVPIVCEVVGHRLRLDGRLSFALAAALSIVCALLTAWAHPPLTAWRLFALTMNVFGLSQFVFWVLLVWLKERTSNWGRGRPVLR